MDNALVKEKALNKGG